MLTEIYVAMALLCQNELTPSGLLTQKGAFEMGHLPWNNWVICFFTKLRFYLQLWFSINGIFFMKLVECNAQSSLSFVNHHKRNSYKVRWHFILNQGSKKRKAWGSGPQKFNGTLAKFYLPMDFQIWRICICISNGRTVQNFGWSFYRNTLQIFP